MVGTSGNADDADPHPIKSSDDLAEGMTAVDLNDEGDGNDGGNEGLQLPDDVGEGDGDGASAVPSLLGRPQSSAAPLPPSNDLDALLPPPSPRQRTLDLDEPISGDASNVALHTAPSLLPAGPDSSGALNEHERQETPEVVHTAQSFEHPRESSLLVHLGAHTSSDATQSPLPDDVSSPPATATVSGPAATMHQDQQHKPTGSAQPTFQDPDGVGSLPVTVGSPGSAPPIPGDGSMQVSIAQAQNQQEGEENEGTSPTQDEAAANPPSHSTFSFSAPPPRTGPAPAGSRGGGMIRFRTLMSNNSNNGAAGGADVPQDAVEEQSRPEQAQPRGLEPTTLAEQLRNMVGSGQGDTGATNLYLFGANGGPGPGDISGQGPQRPGGPPRIRQYAYPSHADSDTLVKELEEFFSYVEAPQVLENKSAWQEWAQSRADDAEPAAESSEATAGSSHSPSYAWTKLPSSVRQRHVRDLLAELSNEDPNQRVTASRAFAYLLQGSFADTYDQEHQEHWIKLNAKMAREEGGIAAVYEATKRILWKHDFLSSLPDHVDSRATDEQGAPLLTPQSKAEYLDEVNMELILCFTQLYILIETGRRDEEEAGDAAHHDSAGTGAPRLSDDLMDLDPPLPVHLWLVVAGLREKNAKGFPVKKLLLCLWKSLLTCLGGFSDIQRCKALARKIEGLPPANTFRAPSAQWPPSAKDGMEAGGQPASQPYTTAQSQPYHPTAASDGSHSSLLPSRLELGRPRKARPTKATPLDFDNFREELAVKYPTYIPPRRTPADLPIEKVATALDPLPPPRPIGLGGTNGSADGQGGSNAGSNEATGAQPGTPAPTPPPSPRPNKQKFQTDQSRPFVLPFSASVQGDRLVPYSIEEADRLYADNMYVSTEMWQLWRTREELGHEDRGVSSDKEKGLSYSSSSDRWKRSGSSASSLGAPSSRGGLTSASASQHGSEKPSRSNSHDARGWAGLHALSKLEAGSNSPRPPRSSAAAAAASSQANLSSETPPVLSSSGGSGSPRFMGGFSGPGSEADGGVAGRAPVDPEKSFMTRGEPTFERLQVIEQEIQATLARAEGDHLLAVLDNDRFQQTLTTLQQQIADVRRLQRVDLLYKSILGHLQSAVVVLLKLLLATVTAQNSSGAGGQADGQVNNTNIFGVQGNTGDDSGDANAPIPTVEDVDILRHREITTKAVSAILLLSLKWFKASHAMKFHHLSQFLVDSNCMLLILKMFGLQEAAQSVKSINEAPNFNFFRYCQLEGHAGQTQQEPQQDDEVPVGSRSDHPQTAPEVDDGLIHEYSFRNFFSTLNFTRILQKLTKGKVHRILLLVQYKSSAILKRSLKVQHPTLALYVLKVIKLQVPFCGRKWRQSNMKVITGIYLNCRPDLRDEWLSTDVDADVYESLPQEQALRALVKFYITSRFGADADQQITAGQQQQQQQQQQAKPQPASNNAVGDQNALQQAVAEGLPPNLNGDASAGGQQQSAASGVSFFEADVWPPLRRGGPGSAGGPGAAAYIPDDIVEGYLGEYEEMISEVFGEQSGGTGHHGQPSGALTDVPRDGWSSGKWGLTSTGAATAWNALGEILGDRAEDPQGLGSSDVSSDSETESIASIGELDFSRPNNARGVAMSSQAAAVPGSPRRIVGAATNEARDEDEEEGRTNWEHLSPKEMRFLSSSAIAAADPTTSPLGSPTMSRNRRLSASGPTLDIGGATGATRGRTSRPSSRRSSHSGQRASSSRSPSSTFGRTGSDSQPLRPVLDFEAMDLEAALAKTVEDGGVVEDDVDGDDENGDDDIMPRPAAQQGGIDEVEHVFGQ